METESQTQPDWAVALSDPASFSREQTRLGFLWTLLGLITDIPNNGDWFRGTLGGRSVFVQRFDDSLVGFENVCAHRFFPLRTKDRGNGPIRCGFHHWQYNKEGVAVGIPKCVEMFGVTPRELNAKLTPVEIATCGILIFGRFAGARDTETLEQSFGESFSILQAMWSIKHAPYQIKAKIRANWKLLYHITLDDYHVVAVHPGTFGKEGYLPNDRVRYFHMGRHSAYFYGADGHELSKMADECRRGDYRPENYRIFQIFPNLLTVHFQAALNWYVLIQQYIPVAFDHTLSRSWFFQAPFPSVDRTWVHGLLRRLVAPFVRYVLPFYIQKIGNEDNRVCEQIQSVAHQIKKFPILGRHEERIAWFEEVFSTVMSGELAERPDTNIVRFDGLSRDGEPDAR
jgi:phenylpropionate dioxygenase-like ring-hydroxylating dioxygenase large terminal subunit